MHELGDLLLQVLEHGGSDLHITVGVPPMMRLNGRLVPLGDGVLSAADTRAAIYGIMSEDQRAALERDWEFDFAYSVPGRARFRVNAYFQRNSVGAAFRLIPMEIRTLEQLGLPAALADLALKPRGLVLVTGPTGSGKSTTLAAMMDYVNENEYAHILTVEDPIEFVHQSKKCLINQREVGPHTLSFANALRSALREDPDVILVGELRDLETIRLALTAAETGHLVFGTLHTSSAAKTIDRVVDVFPAAEKEMVRSMLSESLRAVISQTLLKTKDGSGRVAAHEIMIGTPAIRNLIRENKVAQMYSAIQTGGNIGMQTLDQNLQDLVKRNVIAPAVARNAAQNKDAFL